MRVSGEVLAQARDQQLQDAKCMLGLVDVGPAQMGDQQMIAGKDVERQEAVVVVVAVEEAPFLTAVRRIVGRVEVNTISVGGRSKEAMKVSTRTWWMSQIHHGSARFSNRHKVGALASAPSRSAAVRRARSWCRLSWSLRSS